MDKLKQELKRVNLRNVFILVGTSLFGYIVGVITTRSYILGHLSDFMRAIQ